LFVFKKFCLYKTLTIHVIINE